MYEDLQPYTCTWEKCEEPKSFKRKGDWVRHENERHRHLEWWTCQVDDCMHLCYRKSNMGGHLVREHKIPDPKQKTKAAVNDTTEPYFMMLDNGHHETENRPQDELCKFCGMSFTTWRELTVHLAKHMEDISLPIIVLVDAANVDADTLVSPVQRIDSHVLPTPSPSLSDDLGNDGPSVPDSGIGLRYATNLDHTGHFQHGSVAYSIGSAFDGGHSNNTTEVHETRGFSRARAPGSYSASQDPRQAPQKLRNNVFHDNIAAPNISSPVNLSTPGRMIHTIVLLGLHVRAMNHANFTIEWDLLTFIRNQYKIRPSSIG